MSHPATPVDYPIAAATDVSSPNAAAPTAIEARGLTRAFGRRVAVRDLTFSVRDGECLALFGPNGAGKTTLLRVLAGLLRPTSGSASIAGVTLLKMAVVALTWGLCESRSAAPARQLRAVQEVRT